MTVQETKANVSARIWKSIAQSGVSVSAIPQEQLEVLVDSIADGVLLAVDEALEEAGLAARQSAGVSLPDLPGEEKVLWQGRPLLSIVTFYQITSERVRIHRGLLSKDRDDIELIRIQDLDQKQSISERMLNVGDIILHSADPTLPETRLNNVQNPQEVHEILRRAMLEARKRFRYSVQEEM